MEEELKKLKLLANSSNDLADIFIPKIVNAIKDNHHTIFIVKEKDIIQKHLTTFHIYCSKCILCIDIEYSDLEIDLILDFNLLKIECCL